LFEAAMQGNSLAGQNLKDQIKALLFECYIFLHPEKRPDKPVDKDALLEELKEFNKNTQQKWFADTFKGIRYPSQYLIIVRIIRLLEKNQDDDIHRELTAINKKLTELADREIVDDKRSTDEQLFD
tara:strand:+ start:2228 stop:2605 length:378 start_codon:yes stop_codon:yes gene_type:complete